MSTLDGSRWRGWGDQKQPVYFFGDTKSAWEILEYEIKFTITSSNASCFYWWHDTGGFYGERNAEMNVDFRRMKKPPNFRFIIASVTKPGAGKNKEVKNSVLVPGGDYSEYKKSILLRDFDNIFMAPYSKFRI